ncbi:hypothetical protein AB0D49_33755 [Streptomyces sp. NPDC048290]|uniref:hypothetical protein n=1 Tax=Streptomyces sp. NPDC048290 TaxID=3155811 RepID=UPI0034146CB6
MSAPLAHFGYRVLIPGTMGEDRAVVQQLDTLLVQARREARIIAWHSGADDLHVLRRLPGVEHEARHPGVHVVADGWEDRARPYRGTALCVDTALDLGPTGLISDTAVAHNLVPLDGFEGGRQQDSAQRQCDRPAAGAPVDGDALAAGVLYSALATALLGGLRTGRLHWQGALSIRDPLEQVAWSAAPPFLGGPVPTTVKPHPAGPYAPGTGPRPPAESTR